MTLNYNILNIPDSRVLITSMSSGYGRKQLVSEIVKCGQCAFTVKPLTKTSLDVRISIPNSKENYVVGVDNVPPGAEKFKFLTRRFVSPYYGTEYYSNYFKVSQTQGIDQLNEYLQLVLEELLSGHEDISIDVTVVLCGTESILETNNYE